MSKIKDFIIDLQNKSAELQKNIERLLSEFKEDTGIYVEEIKLTNYDATSIKEECRKWNQDVKVTVRLP